MAAPQLILLDSLDAIRAAAPAWDDLWRRSDVAVPVARAELVAQWIEAASPQATVRGLAVRQDGQLVAALPLVGGRVKRLVRVGRLPSNYWAWAGDLLLDPSADAPPVLETLAAAVGQLPWPLLWLDAVPLQTPRWREFVAALDAGGLASSSQQRFCIGQVEIDHDWPGYQARLSANHRHHMRRINNRATDDGGATLKVYRDPRPEEIDDLLRRGFAIEDRSWKGTEGSSVLQRPAHFQYYCRQARQLAEWGQLQLTFLELAGQPIAFEYGWNARGVYFSPKVGYDDKFSRLSPGQLLRRHLLERFFADHQQHLFDFIGPLSTATAKWITGSYPVGRIVVDTGRGGGRALLRLYESWWAGLRRLRYRREAENAKF